MPTCEIVVRCHNEEQHIGRLLGGIMQQTVRDVQVVVVDSGCTDGTLSVASLYLVEILSISPEEFSSVGRSTWAAAPGYSLTTGDWNAPR